MVDSPSFRHVTKLILLKKSQPFSCYGLWVMIPSFILARILTFLPRSVEYYHNFNKLINFFIFPEDTVSLRSSQWFGYCSHIDHSSAMIFEYCRRHSINAPFVAKPFADTCFLSASRLWIGMLTTVHHINKFIQWGQQVALINGYKITRWYRLR